MLFVVISRCSTVQEWIFESLDGIPRLLKSRSGHHAPPAHVRFYGDDGKTILSAGRDKSLRMICTIRDEQNIELSQGSLEKKAKAVKCKIDALRLPAIFQISSCILNASPHLSSSASSRQLEWDNILTCHLDCSSAFSWSFDRKAIGQHTFKSLDGTLIKVRVGSVVKI